MTIPLIRKSLLKRWQILKDVRSPVGPSPEEYKKAFGEDEVTAFCVTLSAELSGSYNSAVLGQRLVEEEFPNKKVYVFNSRSACIGETLVALKIQECAEKGASFERL